MSRDRQLPPLKALLAFDAGARHGSFTKAAEELHVTQTAISHQVRLLEGHFEQKLFDRTSRDLALTDSGIRLRAVTTELFDRLDQISRELKPGATSVQDPLRITLPPSLGSFWLAPKLGQFWAEHSIDLHLMPAREILDFQLHKVDLGIRCGSGSWPGMEAEFLMPMNIVPVCSPVKLTMTSGESGWLPEGSTILMVAEVLFVWIATCSITWRLTGRELHWYPCKRCQRS